MIPRRCHEDRPKNTLTNERAAKNDTRINTCSAIWDTPSGTPVNCDVARKSRTDSGIASNAERTSSGVWVGPAGGVVFPPPGVVFPPPGVVLPPPGVIFPPPGVIFPPPGVVFPPPGVVFPPPGVAFPPPGVVFPPPGVTTGAGREYQYQAAKLAAPPMRMRLQ